MARFAASRLRARLPSRIPVLRTHGRPPPKLTPHFITCFSQQSQNDHLPPPASYRQPGLRTHGRLNFGLPAGFSPPWPASRLRGFARDCPPPARPPPYAVTKGQSHSSTPPPKNPVHHVNHVQNPACPLLSPSCPAPRETIPAPSSTKSARLTQSRKANRIRQPRPVLQSCSSCKSCPKPVFSKSP